MIDRNVQLPLGFELDDVGDDARERGISPAEAQLISRSAQAALEDGASGMPAWARDYLDLRQDGWPWRVAVLIAWSASPRDGRHPKTQADLANSVLGLKSDRVIREWKRKNPAIEAAIGVLEARQLFEHRAQVLRALADSASSTSHKNHPDRKLFLELTGDYTPRVKVDQNVTGKPKDMAGLSDAELAVIERNLDDEHDARNAGSRGA